MANNTYIGGEIKLIGGLSDLFAIDSNIIRYTKTDNEEISIQQIINELLGRINALEGSKNNVARITLTSPVTNIVYGENTNSFKITAKVEPDTAINKSINWESSSTANLTVNNEGLVNFISAVTRDNNRNESVTVRITATSVQNPAISASCDIIVKKANNTITIKKGTENISGSKINVKLIDNITLTATDLSRSTISWASDKTEILNINENGQIQFGNQYNTGDVKITASVPNSENYKGTSSQTTLSVSKATDNIHFKLNNVEKTEISKTISTNEAENSFKLNVTSDSTNTIKSFESSNTNIATITKDSNGIYTVRMLKWDANPITLTATTKDDRDKRYSIKEETLRLTVNPITQSLSANPSSLSWSGSEALNAKEITISGNQPGSTLSVSANNNITSYVRGPKVSITPNSRGINTSVTINASKTNIYREASINVTVKVDAQSINYYWYVGQTNPTSMASISPIVNDNTSPGWRLIGTSVPTYSSSNMLWEGSVNPIATGTTKQIIYVAIPNSTIKLRDGDGNVVDNYTNIGTKIINGVNYYIYQSPVAGKTFVWDIY